MSQISRRLEQSLDKVRTLSLDQQDLLAVELMERAGDLLRPAIETTPEERADLEAALAAARRGEFATEEEVAAMYAKYGLRGFATRRTRRPGSGVFSATSMPATHVAPAR